VPSKQEPGDSDHLVTARSRQLGALVRFELRQSTGLPYRRQMRVLGTSTPEREPMAHFIGEVLRFFSSA
jgi:hypothetical protein